MALPTKLREICLVACDKEVRAARERCLEYNIVKGIAAQDVEASLDVYQAAWPGGCRYDRSECVGLLERNAQLWVR